jgi:predicted naringenin-chalcone synthase
MTMTFAIHGLATAHPDCSIQQSAAADIAAGFVGSDGRKPRGLTALFERTKVRTRGSVLLGSGNGDGPRQSFYWPSTGPEDHGPSTADRMQRYAAEAGPLSLRASRQALDDGGISPEQVTHLVTVSCTGFFAPGIDIALTRQLGLPATVGRLNVGFMGCHGALNGLRAVQAIGQSDPSAIVLLCAVELCSLHYQYGRNPQQLVANALFGDGAAALVGRGATGGDLTAWRVASCGSCLIPEAEDAMTWSVGNHGFEMSLSSQVPALIGRHLRPWLECWLAESGRRLSDIRSWAIHPGGPRILTSVADALQLPPQATEVSEQVLAEHGNMSSPTVLFVLERFRRSADSRPCILLAFGPGLVAEAVLIE